MTPFPKKEYAEAVAREQLSRDVDFLFDDGLLRESICGIEVLPFSLFHLLILRAGGSPFVAEQRTPTPIDVVQFLWVVSPRYCASRFARWRFVRRCRNLIFMDALKAIAEYMNETFQDSPVSGDSVRIPTFSGCAGMVDLFASEYGWTRGEIFHCPIRILFQLRNARSMRLGHKDPAGNPSMSIRQQWLDENCPTRN